MTSYQERKMIVDDIEQARKDGCRLAKACEVYGLSVRTYQRWYRRDEVIEDCRPKAMRPEPSHKLTPEEREAIMNTVNEKRFQSLPPTQIVPTLLDEGSYIASESSFYRVMEEHEQNNRRGRAKEPSKRSKPDEFVADGPDQVWSWDITYLASQTKGKFYYLYLIMDIFGRDIVGYEVHDAESGELGKEVFDRAYVAVGMPKGLVLHSDNGSPMKSFTMKAKLDDLGITPSYSRPQVSNDNPYSEALFRTVKYCPAWPSKGFESLGQARAWVERFVRWYNCEHKHSKIKFVTPHQRRHGQEHEILLNRKAVLEKAKQLNPARWSGATRNCDPAGPVRLNPDKLKHVS